MAATNKDQFVWSGRKDGLPHVFRGLVQAGSSQAIKIGEICCFNKTAGYWIPVSAVADFIYALAISKEEQKAADSARYMEFYSLHPEDVFEFPADAALALALGDGFTLTASDSQTLTYSATAYPVARNVGDGHYPETGTTIRNQSYVRVSFNIACSAWGLLISKEGLHRPKVVNSTAVLTLYPEQSGLIITNLGAGDLAGHNLPQTPPVGTHYTAMALAAQDVGFDPGAGGGIYIENSKQTDNLNATVDAIGDSVKVTAIGDGDWFGQTSITSAADQTGGLDIA